LVRHAITIICLLLAAQAPAQVPRNVMDWLSVAAQDSGGAGAPTNYIAYWSFDADASDATGNYSATSTNGAPVFSGSGGVGNRGYVTHDALDEFYIIPAISPAGTGDDCSFMFWANRDGFTDSYHLFGDLSGSTWHVSYLDAGSAMRFIFTGNQYAATTNFAAFPSGWHHYAFVKDGTGVYNGGAFSDVYFFYDGERVDTSSYGGWNEIGALDLLLKSYGSFHSRGSIDELRVYDYVLSTNEVQTTYNAEKF